MGNQMTYYAPSKMYIKYRVIENNKVIARFLNVDDAQRFAETITENGTRDVSVHDTAGWVDFYYSNGHTTSIRS